MQYVEASQFGGPEVRTVKEKETPKPGEGMLLLEVQAAGVNYPDVAARTTQTQNPRLSNTSYKAIQ